jgi:hypothetical protein
MCDWAYVSTNKIAPDQTRRHLVLYCAVDTMDESVVYPVTFRVQGFIEHAKLTALGDWDGCVYTFCNTFIHNLTDAQEFDVGNECYAVSDVVIRRPSQAMASVSNRHTTCAPAGS